MRITALVIVLVAMAAAARGGVTPLFGCWCNSSCAFANLPDVTAGVTRVFAGYIASPSQSLQLPATATLQTTNNEVTPGNCLVTSHGITDTFYRSINPEQMVFDIPTTCLGSSVTWTTFGNDLIMDDNTMTEERYCEYHLRRDASVRSVVPEARTQNDPTLTHVQHYREYVEWYYNNTSEWTEYVSMCDGMLGNLNSTNFVNYSSWQDDPHHPVLTQPDTGILDVLVKELTLQNYVDDIWSYMPPGGTFGQLVASKQFMKSEYQTAVQILEVLHTVTAYVALASNGDIIMRARFKYTII